MVDAVGIKEFRHVLESAYPPYAVVFQHLIPVVCWESPVLTIHREIIRWSTRLAVDIEVFRLHPNVATISVYADRNIALQYHMLRACVVVGSLYL